MSNETALKPQSDGFFSKIRTPLLFGLTLVLALGVYYFFFVQKKASYLTSRNFRFLSAIGAQVEATLTGRSTLLKNLGKNCDAANLIHNDAKERNEKEEEDYRAILAEFAPGFEEVREVPTKPIQGLVGIRTSLSETRIEVFHPFPGEGKGCAPSTEPKETKPESLWYGWIRPGTIFGPLFQSRRVFDAVLLADAQGEVVYQEGERELNVTRLASLTGSSPGRNGRSKRQDGREAPALSGASAFYDVELSGREYRLFVEPVLLPLQRLNVRERFGAPPARFDGKEERVWLICGLAPKKELVYGSLAVSSALLTFLLGLLLLAALSWPFLKLKLLGETQRIGIFDVLMLGVCSLLGLSIATIFVLDFWAFGSLKKTAETQLESLAERIEANALNEMDAAFNRLSRLEEAAAKDSQAEKTSYLATGHQVSGGHPLASIFLVLDKNGMQKYKWTLNKRLPPRIAVRERDYFNQAISGNLWRIEANKDRKADSDPVHLFAESIVGNTTGIRMAMVSKRVTEPALVHQGLKVAVLGIPMISLINPVLPPGFKFAIINNEDENGRVLFHSDSARNRTEDFLIETDRNRRLRSTVFARRAETMRLRYWGEDYIARTMPVKGTPWTVVALRDLQMLRAVNLEWISTTLFFVLLYVGLLTALFLGVAIARPSYRAEWIWPDPLSRARYEKLAIAYLLTVAAFLLSLRALRESNALLAVSALFPGLALVMSYLKLQRDKNSEPRKRIAFGMGSAFLAIVAFFLLGKPNTFVDSLWGALALLLVSTALFSMAPPQLSLLSQPLNKILRRRAAEEDQPDIEAHSVNRSYCLSASLLLLLTAVLPTAGFFQASYRIHVKSFQKHGQLQMARDLKQRALKAAQEFTEEVGKGKSSLLATRLSFEPRTPKDVTEGLDIYTAAFYNTTPEVPEDQQTACSMERGTFLSEVLEALLPRSSEHASEMRELFHMRASDCAWQWQARNDDVLTLQFRDYLEGELHLSSPDPRVTQEDLSIAQAGFFSLEGFGKGGIAALVAVLSIAALLCLVKALVAFMARHVFLIDLLEPLVSRVPATGRNVFVIGNSQQGKENPDPEEYHWFDVKNLDDPETGWPARRAQVLDDERVIVIDNFEYHPSDEEFARKKLRLLEDLVQMQDRTVVVYSAKSPSRLFSRRDDGEGVAPDLERRWRNLRSSFTFQEEDLKLPSTKIGVQNPNLILECGPNPRLQEIARKLELNLGSRQLSREQVLEEFGERAEGYYRALWASCTTDEQVVLEHLAETGLVNEKSRKLIRRLMARGLVHRTAAFRLMNETFRRFVISSNCRGEILAIEKNAGPSAWDKMRGPFFAALAASIVFFLTTQQALFDGVLAGITGLTAGLPAMVQAFDFFSHRPSLPRIGPR